MRRTFFTILCVLIIPTLLRADEPAPVPGVQVLQRMTLPASTSKQKTKEEMATEKARMDALPPQARAALSRQRQNARFQPEPLSTTEKETVSFWLFLPSDYEPKGSKRWPLLLFLHGSGERGADPEKVKVHGPPKLLGDPDKAKDWPFITVSPQCPEGYYWSPVQLAILLDRLERTYKIDKNREYVTGLSMGGGGTWEMLYLYPNRFAAGAPICGGCSPDVAPRLVGVPIWVFHGERDEAVEPEYSKEIVAAVRALGGHEIGLTLYPDLAHDSWTVTYDNPKLYEWMLKQKRSGRSSRR